MNILVTGSGTSGSWEVRGEQLGRALGAVVQPRATLEDLRVADVVLVVKRCSPELLTTLRLAGRPWVYDIVDAYPQPVSSAWTPAQALAWLRTLVDDLRPNAVVWPTERMRADYGGGGKVVPHHHRPGLLRNPIRERIERVGYEGSPRYLDGGLAGDLAEQCRRRGAQFILNPAQLADVDVVVALRSARWNGYATRHWKSGVKLANAHASGTPFIGAGECGYVEAAVGGECWAETPEEVGAALDALAPRAARLAISERFAEASFSVEQAAELMKAVLVSVSGFP